MDYKKNIKNVWKDKKRKARREIIVKDIFFFGFLFLLAVVTYIIN